MASGLLEHEPTHPLARLVEALEAVFAAGEDAPAWTLTPSELADLLPRLARAKRRAEGVELQMLREADRHRIGDAVGFANTAAWWANATRATKPAAHQAVALAAELDKDEHAPARSALAAGDVSREQAAVVVKAVDALPADLVDPEVRSRAEQHLIGFAADHDPRELRFLGRRILEYVAPDVAEEHERRVLEAEESRALATATLSMHLDGHGSVVGRFKIPVLAGEMLRKHLEAVAAPRHQAASGPLGAKVAKPLRLGQAFAEYIETRPTVGGMPQAGGIAATVVVTMTLDSLLGGATAATLDTGERISASQARRVACEAGIIPAVLGGASQPLDVGRKRRFHTEPQRTALALKYRGCAIEGCDWTPGMSPVHHLTS